MGWSGSYVSLSRSASLFRHLLCLVVSLQCENLCFRSEGVTTRVWVASSMSSNVGIPASTSGKNQFGGIFCGVEVRVGCHIMFCKVCQIVSGSLGSEGWFCFSMLRLPVFVSISCRMAREWFRLVGRVFGFMHT